MSSLYYDHCIIIKHAILDTASLVLPDVDTLQTRRFSVASVEYAHMRSESCSPARFGDKEHFRHLLENEVISCCGIVH